MKQMTIYNLIAIRCSLFDFQRTFVKEGIDIIYRLAEYSKLLKHYEGLAQNVAGNFSPSEQKEWLVFNQCEQDRCAREPYSIEQFDSLLNDLKCSFTKEVENINIRINELGGCLKIYERGLADSEKQFRQKQGTTQLKK